MAMPTACRERESERREWEEATVLADDSMLA
jgi:hypothetical protein